MNQNERSDIKARVAAGRGTVAEMNMVVAWAEEGRKVGFAAMFDTTGTVKCACGHTVRRQNVMHASLGTTCVACYDRMSR
jgi:hypothetical protein